MTAYYNENDSRAAAWLRELMAEGWIPEGYVDERSILDVRPHELTSYAHQHFFAGIGGWAYALRLAGWPDERPVRTGSCPCQPFSAAGRGRGTADPRHLWPNFRDLLAFGEAAITFGEQVASAAGRDWLAGVRADLEGLGYEVGAADLCAAGLGAPHLRQRLYWVAHPHHRRRPARGGNGRPEGAKREGGDGVAEQRGGAGGVGNAAGERRDFGGDDHDAAERAEIAARAGSAAEPRCGACGMDHSPSTRCDWSLILPEGAARKEARGRLSRSAAQPDGGAGGVADAAGLHGPQQFGEPGEGARRGAPEAHPAERGGPGFWSNFDLLPCSDGKARRVESGTFPLAHGVPGRVGLLRGYGNAIVPQVAALFIEEAAAVILERR